MLIILNKFINIDKIILYILMKLIDNLKMMNIFDILTFIFLSTEKNNKFHQQLLHFFIKLLTFLRIILHTSTIKQHSIVCYNLSQNILNQLVIRINHIITTQLELNVQHLVYDL